MMARRTDFLKGYWLTDLLTKVLLGTPAVSIIHAQVSSKSQAEVKLFLSSQFYSRDEYGVRWGDVTVEDTFVCLLFSPSATLLLRYSRHPRYSWFNWMSPTQRQLLIIIINRDVWACLTWPDQSEYPPVVDNSPMNHFLDISYFDNFPSSAQFLQITQHSTVRAPRSSFKTLLHNTMTTTVENNLTHSSLDQWKQNY